MILPDDRDEAIEWLARHVESGSSLDTMGRAQRRKGERSHSKRLRRAAEDHEVRCEAIAWARKECARDLRAFINRPELSALGVLERIAYGIAKAPLADHVALLRDAWALAHSGKPWLRIEITTRCDDNTIPPAVKYRISLTQRGAVELEAWQRGEGAP